MGSLCAGEKSEKDDVGSKSPLKPKSMAVDKKGSKGDIEGKTGGSDRADNKGDESSSKRAKAQNEESDPPRPRVPSPNI